MHTKLHCMVADVKKGPVNKNEPHAMDSQRISMMYSILGTRKIME